MVAPIITAALIGAGASLAGGALGRDSARSQQASNAAIQREFAQHGIRWKVADAKAAGLHPLYAMQGAGTTYSPSTFVDPMGQGVAQAGRQIGAGIAGQGAERLAAEESQARRAMYEQQAVLANRQSLVAEEEWWRRKLDTINREEQGMLYGRGGFAAGLEPEVIPGQTLSRREGGETHMVRRTPAGWMEVEIMPGIHFLAPATEESWAEGMEGLGPTAATIIANIAYYSGIGIEKAKAKYAEMSPERVKVWRTIANRILKRVKE